MQCRGRLAHVVVKFRKSADDDNDDDGGCPALDVWTVFATATGFGPTTLALRVTLSSQHGNQIKSRSAKAPVTPVHSCTPNIVYTKFVIAPLDLIRICCSIATLRHDISPTTLYYRLSSNDHIDAISSD